MPDKIEGPARVAFVAGAGGGIGRAIVDRFRGTGFWVAAADLETPGEAADGYLPLRMDATDERQVIAAMGSAADRFGPLDVVVNAVGRTGAGPLADLALDDWDAIVAVNLTSAFLVAKQTYTRLRKPGGVLVLFGSTNGRIGGTKLSGPAYGAAKAGILNLTRYLAREWAPDGLRVNALAPGPVDTPMLDRLDADTQDALKSNVPLGAFASPEEIAGAVAFLCSDDARSITGAILNISGGLVLD